MSRWAEEPSVRGVRRGLRRANLASDALPRFPHLSVEPFPAGTRLMIKGELDSPPIPPDHPLLSELRQKRSTKPRSERGFTFVAELGRHATLHGSHRRRRRQF